MNIPPPPINTLVLPLYGTIFLHIITWLLYSFFLTGDHFLGVQVVQGKGCARAYPFEEAQKERTHDQMQRFAIQALEEKKPQFGVKGPSMLSKVSHFDLVNGFVPNFLHCALLGVARQLTSLWFESSNHESPWYIGQPSKQAKYDANLKNIFVPNEIRRLPRSITTREHWKA